MAHCEGSYKFKCAAAECDAESFFTWKQCLGAPAPVAFVPDGWEEVLGNVYCPQHAAAVRPALERALIESLGNR